MDAVFAYQNPLFIAKYSKKFNVSEEVAQGKFTELKKFLILCAVSSGAISPSKEMDDVWHEFILFTRDYYNFCNMFFGKMIHHQPEVVTNKEQLSNAKNRYLASCDKANELFK